MKNEMNGFGKIFTFTFSRQWKNKGFLTGTIIFALLCFLLPAGIMSALEYFGSNGTPEEATGAEIKTRQVFVADQTAGAGADFSLLTQTGVKGYDTVVYTLCPEVDKALDKASKNPQSLVLVLKQEEGKLEIDTIIPDGSSLTKEDAALMNSFWERSIQAVFLQKSGISPDKAAGLIQPTVTETKTAGTDSLSETETAVQSLKKLLGFLLPYLNSLVLYFLVLLYGQSVANNVIMEKTSKLMDTFLVTVKPSAMIFGKVLAVTAASVLQFVIVLAALIGGFSAGGMLVRTINPDSDMILLVIFDSLGQFEGLFSVPGIILAVVMMVSGFLLYCALAAVGGSAAGKPEDLASTNVLFTLALVVSFLATLYAGGIGGGAFAAWLDFVPFTSILVTPSRIMLGEVSLGMGMLSLLIVLVTSVLILYLAGKVYRMMALYKGNPPTPAKLMEMLKQKKPGV